MTELLVHFSNISRENLFCPSSFQLNDTSLAVDSPIAIIHYGVQSRLVAISLDSH